MSARPLRGAAAGLAIALLVASWSCGRDAERPDPTDRPVTVEPTSLKATAELSGALDAKETYESSYASAAGKTTCEELAARKSSKDSEISFVLPMPTRTGSRRLTWSAVIRPYDGPETYDGDRIPDLAVEIKKGKSETGDRFESSTDTDAEATVEDDGSGSFMFSGLSGPSDETLSGEITWTCSD